MNKRVIAIGSLIFLTVLIAFQNCSQNLPSTASLAAPLSSEEFDGLLSSASQLPYQSSHLDVVTAYQNEVGTFCAQTPSACGSVQGIVADEFGNPFRNPGAIVSILEPAQVSFPFGTT